MRPRTLDESAGQRHLLAPGKPLRDSIEKGTVTSMVFWGPPGTGKTTLARLIAGYTDREFVPFSAVTEGVPRVREIVREAQDRLDTGRGTILFADEIHRFNKAQQDAFLPHVEAGTITLIGATTENPSFEINGALLSRVRVFVLQPLSTEDTISVVQAALTDRERGLGALDLAVDEDATALLAREADRRCVDDGKKFLDVVDQEPVEEVLVAILKGRQADELLERVRLARDVVVGPSLLLLQAADGDGKKPLQPEVLSFLRVEGRTLRVQGMPQQPRAADGHFGNLFSFGFESERERFHVVKPLPTQDGLMGRLRA